MEKNQNVNNEETELDINHLMQIRREKLIELQEQGKNPFEITKFDRTNTAGEIKANYEEYEQKDVTVAGRIIAKRIMGKASFCTIQDSENIDVVNEFLQKNKNFELVPIKEVNVDLENQEKIANNV